MKKKRQNKKRRKKLSPKAMRWFVVLSITIGLSLGFLLWFFLTRCKLDDCILHYFPLKEFIGFGFFFWLLPYILTNEELRK